MARRSPDGETVLHLAARRGGREMAELLLAHPEVDSRTYLVVRAAGIPREHMAARTSLPHDTTMCKDKS